MTEGKRVKISLHLFGAKQEEEVENCQGGRSQVPTFYR